MAPTSYSKASLPENRRPRLLLSHRLLSFFFFFSRLAQADPSHLGTLCARDFEVFTRRMVTAAERLCAGRLVSVLEGGYALDCQATVRHKGHG